MNNTVKFTRDCLALGEHCEIGSIKSLPEKTCRELVNEGAAIYFSAPEKAQIETATAIPQHESADIKTTKKSKAK